MRDGFNLAAAVEELGRLLPPTLSLEDEIRVVDASADDHAGAARHVTDERFDNREDVTSYLEREIRIAELYRDAHMAEPDGSARQALNAAMRENISIEYDKAYRQDRGCPPLALMLVDVFTPGYGGLGIEKEDLVGLTKRARDAGLFSSIAELQRSVMQEIEGLDDVDGDAVWRSISKFLEENGIVDSTCVSIPLDDDPAPRSG